MMRRWVAGLAVVVLAGCANTDAIDKANRPAPGAEIETIYVASTRAGIDPATPASTQKVPLHFAVYEIAVPPRHRPGHLPKDAGGSGLDPQVNFLAVGHRPIAGASAFRTAAADAARERSSSPSEIVVFVHGFNTSLAESVTGQAQIANDVALPAAQIVYDWPSANRTLAYADDIPRAEAATDGLARLLSLLAETRVQRIVLVGYSMGAIPVMESLGKLQTNAAVMAKTDVVLLAPDIELDRFTGLANRLSGLQRPIAVFGSHEDLLIKLVSRFMHDGEPLLGALPDPRMLSPVRVTYVDVANVKHTGNGHFAVMGGPALIRMVNAMPRPDLVRFAESAGRIPGATSTRHGKSTYVLLPRLRQ
jgi:esterase/lipase superfamily enzyme